MISSSTILSHQIVKIAKNLINVGAHNNHFVELMFLINLFHFSVSIVLQILTICIVRIAFYRNYIKVCLLRIILDHRAFFRKEATGCCDCGDPSAISNKNSFCKLHREQKIDR